jgi:bacterial/archaeal transporter family protein
MASWLIFALLSAVTAALVAIFGKIGLNGIDANTATAIRSIIMALFMVGVVMYEGKMAEVGNILENKKALFYIALTGIAGALSWMFYFMAIKHGKVSQVAPIDKLSVVIAVVFAVIFLGEKLSLMGGIGVAFIAVGALLESLG